MKTNDWHCSNTNCGKKLGISLNGRMHLKFARGHEYLVGFPVTCICRGCQTLNELREPDRINNIEQQ
jgi:gamma-glutamyl-gamma-aminobutyrate hydrolase PuuD